jgi:ABC-type methionine transport system permease subunit
MCGFFQGIDFGILPILLFFVCIGLVTLIAVAAWACVVFFGSCIAGTMKSAVLFLTATHQHIPAMLQPAAADAAVSSLSRFPFILSGILVGLAAASCGGIAVCLGTLAHFLQLFMAYKKYVQLIVREDESEDQQATLEKRKKDLLSSINIQFSFLLIWAFSALMHLPSMLAWQRNLPDVSPLNPDPSLIPSVLMCVSLAATWGDRAPRLNARGYGRLAQLTQAACIFLAMYGSVSLYRAPYFVAAALVAVGVHQLIATDLSPEELQKREEEKAERTARQLAREASGAPVSGGDSPSKCLV